MSQISSIRTALQAWWIQSFGEIQIGSGKEISGGWLSQAFCFDYVTTTTSGVLFLRTCKSTEGGYTYSNDRFSTFAISHEMYERANGPVKSYGVFGINRNGILANSIFDPDLSYFHVQDFKPGFSLLRESDRYHEMNVLNTIAVNRMKSVGKLLAGLHNISIAHIPNHSNAVRRSQREMLTHPQITLDVLSCYPHDHAILGIDNGKYEYIQNMLRYIDSEAEYSDTTPCVPLHGDFWGSNILIDEMDEPFLIDYSRVPYSDPAIDVGTFLGVEIFDGLSYDAESCFEAANIFLNSYLEYRNISDPGLLRRCVIMVFWIGIIRMYPPVFGNTSPEKMNVFARYITQCYTEKNIILQYSQCK